jgi:protein-tyrosine phosphatase
MTQIIIPANTNNSICKVADFEFGAYPSALYIGSLQAASDPFTLKQYKIGSVLTVASEFIVKPGAGIAHKVIAVEDSPFEDLYQYISEANEFIAKQLGRGNVLVHCRAGISRSATLILAFLMKSKRWKLKHAL